MRNDVQAIDNLHPRSAAIRQPQATPDRLLDKSPGIGRPQRNNGIEIGHVPAFFQHVHVNHNLGRLCIALHQQQATDHFFLFRTRFAAIDLNHLALVLPIKQALYRAQQCGSMGGIAGDHQHERLHGLLACLLCIGQQMHFGFFMNTDAVHELDALQLLRTVVSRVEVLLRHHGGLFHEAVFDGERQGIVHHHILERYRALRSFSEGCRRQFKAQQRLQLIKRPDAGTSTVAVRLVHDEYEVWQTSQVLKITLTEVFRKPLDLRCFAAANF